MPGTPGHDSSGPVIDYLLKEVSFSTCDNKFFGELEKEMLIPNNLNIYGRVKGATSLNGFKLRLEIPDEIVIAYIMRPVSNLLEGNKRVLTYNLLDLLNYEDYWWLPLETETEFSLRLNLLPPFPQLNPVDLAISCRPDVAIGLEAEVTTTVSLKAEEHIDNFFLTISTPPFYSPGVSMAITEFSEDNIADPRQTVTSPIKAFPFEHQNLDPGKRREFKVKTKITANLSGMTSLKCQQDLLKTKLILLSETSSEAAPFNVSILDAAGRAIPVDRTEMSTVHQAAAQIMYSPFSIRRELPKPERKVLIQAAAS